MCDTFRPLFPTRAAIDLDDDAYPASWQGEHFPPLGHRPLAQRRGRRTEDRGRYEPAE